MRGLCAIYIIPRHEGEARVAGVYESHTSGALVHNCFKARKYHVLPRDVTTSYINNFPANTFFYDVYQIISAKFLAKSRVAPVTWL